MESKITCDILFEVDERPNTNFRQVSPVNITLPQIWYFEQRLT